MNIGGSIDLPSAGGGGEGDFKADGSVPLTGDLDAGGNDLTNVTAVSASEVNANQYTVNGTSVLLTNAGLEMDGLPVNNVDSLTASSVLTDLISLPNGCLIQPDGYSNTGTKTTCVNGGALFLQEQGVFAATDLIYQGLPAKEEDVVANPFIIESWGGTALVLSAGGTVPGDPQPEIWFAVAPELGNREVRAKITLDRMNLMGLILSGVTAGPYADDTAATGAGLVSGELYFDALGAAHVVL